MRKSEAEQFTPCTPSPADTAGEELAERSNGPQFLNVLSLIKPTISKLSCFALHEAWKGILIFTGFKDLWSDFIFITLVLYHFNSSWSRDITVYSNDRDEPHLVNTTY